MNMHPAQPPQPPQPFATTTGETRATAFKEVKASSLKRLNDDLLYLVRGAQANGCQDLSLRELQQAYELRHGKRIELGTVSGAVTRLVAGNKLVRLGNPRRCNVTGREILPFFVPAEQVSFL